MPNIVIVGHSSIGICSEISKIVTDLGIKADEGVITFSPDLCCLDMSEQHRDSPYLVVRDTDGEEAAKIASALNEALEIDVEIQVLSGFLPHHKKGEVPSTGGICPRCNCQFFSGNYSPYCSSQCAAECGIF